jgi:predicted adenylyl cyclase CyaB
MTNVEIKAEVSKAQQEVIRDYLRRSASARFKGTDLQTDTYFKVLDGRLKLREGNIENYLVQYERPNQTGPKTSKCILTKVFPEQIESLKQSLKTSLGVMAVVKKQRGIYYVDNVKVHLDYVNSLERRFVEIEAQDEREICNLNTLRSQCVYMMIEFGIKEEQLIHNSYSDMVLSD